MGRSSLARLGHESLGRSTGCKEKPLFLALGSSGAVSNYFGWTRRREDPSPAATPLRVLRRDLPRPQAGGIVAYVLGVGVIALLMTFRYGSRASAAFARRDPDAKGIVQAERSIRAS